MRPFDQLTTKELGDLTEDQIQYYCDLACAERGVPFLPPEPTGPERPDADQTMTLSQLSGGYRDFFMSAEHAAEIMELVNSKQLYKSEGSDPYKYAKPIGPDDYNYPKLTTESFLSANDAATLKDEIAKYNTVKSEYDSLSREYRDIRKKRQEETEFIRDRINEARETLRRIATAGTDFNRYLELSENNPTVAMNFLLKANDFLREDEYREAMLELCPGYDFTVPEPAPEIRDQPDPDDDDDL